MIYLAAIGFSGFSARRPSRTTRGSSSQGSSSAVSRSCRSRRSCSPIPRGVRDAHRSRVPDRHRRRARGPALRSRCSTRGRIRTVPSAPTARSRSAATPAPGTCSIVDTGRRARPRRDRHVTCSSAAGAAPARRCGSSPGRSSPCRLGRCRPSGSSWSATRSRPPPPLPSSPSSSCFAAVPCPSSSASCASRLARSSVSELVVALETGEPLRDALAGALGDPELDVVYWLDWRPGPRRRRVGRPSGPERRRSRRPTSAAR